MGMSVLRFTTPARCACSLGRLHCLCFTFWPEHVTQGQVPCPQCAIPNFLTTTSYAYAYASVSVTVGLNAYASARASASSSGGRLLQEDNLNVSLPVMEPLSFPNGTAPSELPGLLAAYSYDPSNKSTSVLYNVTAPVQPPSIDDIEASESAEQQQQQQGE